MFDLAAHWIDGSGGDDTGAIVFDDHPLDVAAAERRVVSAIVAPMAALGAALALARHADRTDFGGGPA